jgi:hypothetical protein
VANHNREDAEGVFLRRLKDLGLTAGVSFYANEIDKQAAAIVARGKLTSAQYYMLAALVEDVAFRCLAISPSQPWIQSAHECQERLARLDNGDTLAAALLAGNVVAVQVGNERRDVASFGGGCKVFTPADTPAIKHPTIDELIANDRPD